MKLEKFKVTNYRNITDSDWIFTNDVTAFVGPNEAGKSNHFEALYRINPFEEHTDYNIDEDWPVSDWGGRNENAVVCEAHFIVTDESVLKELWDTLITDSDDEQPETSKALPKQPKDFKVIATRNYSDPTEFQYECNVDVEFDSQAFDDWVLNNMPKFVYVEGYSLGGYQTELNVLAQKKQQHGWNNLTPEEQTIFTILELAKVDIDDFLQLGQTQEGRTKRSFDKRAASAYLTKQFQRLWSQKKVRFDIEIDNTTLNIFAEDEGVGMPVRLHRRSTGFRWHVSFAWKFTHASNGEFNNCILLLEEPGVHLHPDGQRDLLQVFDELSESNMILYTTHLASLIDPAYPERIRIVEELNHESKVIDGVVSTNRAPMAVIEARLGLRGDLAGLLGNRKTLVVEGGDEQLILQKLSNVLNVSNREGLSDQVYMWPAEGASKTPMFAGFMVGQGWDGAVLLDSDEAGDKAKKKITELYLKHISDEQKSSFKVLSLAKAAGITRTDVAIEDIFPEEFYIDCVNKAYGISIKPEDLSEDGSTLIVDRVEHVLKTRHGRSALDKGMVLKQMLDAFDQWKTSDDLPGETASYAEALFKAINSAMA